MEDGGDEPQLGPASPNLGRASPRACPGESSICSDVKSQLTGNVRQLG